MFVSYAACTHLKVLPECADLQLALRVGWGRLIFGWFTVLHLPGHTPLLFMGGATP